MTVTRDQAQMLATLTRASRPNGARSWDTGGIMAALEKVADRALPEVIVAAIHAASDRDNESPAVIALNGPHWQAAAVVKVPPTVKAEECRDCGKPERHPWHAGQDAHPFVVIGAPPPPPLDVRRTVAALKDELAPITPRTEPTGLDALTTRRPELAEAAASIARRCVGLAAPATQEESG